MDHERAHPKLVGDRSTAKVLTRLVEVYGSVFLPFGENQRYDLIVDDGERLLRVQCKTGRLRKGVVVFPACSSTYHHPNAATKVNAHHYRGQADVFGVYCPDIDEVYVIPVDEVGLRRGSLRVTPTTNNQKKFIRWACDYVLRRPSDDVVAEPTAIDPTETLFESAARYSGTSPPG